MDNKQLIFTSDCAINFDDLGDFKDFTEDIQTMLHNLTEVKNNEHTIFKAEMLKQILKADPEDTFHAPAFKDLINVVLQILVQRNEYFKAKPEIYKLIFHNLMQILEQSFVSYQFSQDTGPKICKFVIDEGKRKGFKRCEKMMLLLCISKLAKKLSYIDDLQNYSELLYQSIDEETIMMQSDVSQQWKKMMLEVYCQVVELSTRNRKVRQLLTNKISEQKMLASDHLFLGYKIYLWQRDHQKANMHLKRMEAQLLLNYSSFRLAVNKLA